MTTFVETSEGWLNLDHVILVRHGDAATGETLIQLDDGRTFICHVIDTAPVMDAMPKAPATQPDPDSGFTVGGDYTSPSYRRDRPRFRTPADDPEPVK